jgi:flagellar basal body-associated protein FliL
MAADPKSATDAQDGAKSEEGGAPKKGKKTLFKVGAVLCLLAMALLLAVVTVGKNKGPAPALELDGPFVAKLSSSEIQVNLAGEGSKRYLVMALNVEYLVYDEHYVAGRLVLPAATGGHGGAAPAEDPIYTARIKDALLKIAASKTRDEVTNPALADAFMEEIRRAIDPILFPVHVGDSTSPSKPDTQSGVRVGESGLKSTLRGLLHEHALHFDGPASTVALDDGAAVAFKSTDRDLQLTNKAGDTVHVDLTLGNAKYKGDVPIGRPGRVTQVYRESFLVQ